MEERIVMKDIYRVRIYFENNIYKIYNMNEGWVLDEDAYHLSFTKEIKNDKGEVIDCIRETYMKYNIIKVEIKSKNIDYC